MSTPEARLSPGSVHTLGPINWTIWRVISRAVRVPDAHLFSTLGRQKKLFRAWLAFSAALMPGGQLGRHDTELVILRVAHLRRCAYELDHHTRLAVKAGISADKLACVFEGPEAMTNERERVLMHAVDELVSTKDLGDQTWHELRIHYDEPKAVELCLLVGQYEMLATAIHALRVQRDY